jgi:L-fuconate dehydratase
LLCEMTPEEIVRCIDFRYITDALTPEERIGDLARSRAFARGANRGDGRDGYPCLHDLGGMARVR